MKPLIKVLNKESKENTVWLMRQAGRYLPEYREIRKDAGSFLDLCYNVELASEVTLQPLKRFNIDAAIIFSDILVIPDALGVELDYIKNEGPKLGKIESLGSLKTNNIVSHLQPVYEAINLTKSRLEKNKALIGFVGAPWTIATYMIEGGSSKNFANTKKLCFNEDKFFNDLIEILITAISEHAIEQIKAGADIIQIFDSWSGVLPEPFFTKYITIPNKKIVENIRKSIPDAKIIGFPKGATTENTIKYAKATGINGIGLDSVSEIKKIHANLDIVTQGNIDPLMLLADKYRIKEAVDRLKEEVSGSYHIFNLGHGVVPETSPDHVEYFVNLIKD